mgnify:CR=1 FL=1
MAEIINLRLARKARARVEAEAQAAANRVLHGRIRQEKLAARLDRERQQRSLDGALREPEES